MEFREFKRLMQNLHRTRDGLEETFRGLNKASQDSMDEYITKYIEDVRHRLCDSHIVCIKITLINFYIYSTL